mmetsp:Transcript_107829/g.190736  ORF Transcript_107829/g.190736 Transcript_107829/m.190736 type:complete len:100 (+) Transcript_107829:497-796(+)
MCPTFCSRRSVSSWRFCSPYSTQHCVFPLELERDCGAERGERAGERPSLHFVIMTQRPAHQSHTQSAPVGARMLFDEHWIPKARDSTHAMDVSPRTKSP